MNKLPNWLRWTLCIPSALLAFLIVNGINRITFLTIFGDPNKLFFKIGTIFIEGTVGVIVLLYVLYLLSPNNKNIAIIAASIIIGIIAIIGATLQLIYPNATTPLWQILLPGMLAMGSCFYFCKKVLNSEKKLNN